MKALLIGCGQGGSRLTEAIMKIQYATFGSKQGEDYTQVSVKKLFDAVVINTTDDDLKEVDKGTKGKLIDRKRKLVIGTGYTHTSGHGAGGNPKLGTLAANHDRLRIAAKIEEVLSEINRNIDMNDIDAFFVISALGGGSGSGMAPVIAQLLKENYFEDQYPVIGIVTLPAKEEGQLPSYNAYISLQSWLKESNFDGIITISLGGKFLNYADDSAQYYSKFNKSIAKALYILLGGDTIGSKTTNVDVADILSTIQEGGGLCTLGHLSSKISLKKDGTTESTELLTVEEQISDSEGKEAQELLKAVKRVCNRNNLFLPVDFTRARSALLVIKDSKNFKVSRGAAQQAANWLEESIQGYVRCTDISHDKFRLIASNPKGMDIFESHELSDEDKHLSDNESVEIALLLSGISDVQMIQDMRNTADKVLRFTKPPRGERLLAETLGMPIGEKVNRSMLLPCSHQRENSTAQIQSKIIDEAIRLFVEDISALDPTISLEKNDRGISVIDVIPIPDAVICGIHERIRTQKTCFDVLLRFDNTMDSTYLKTIYSLRIQEYETKRSEIGDNTAWNPPELLHKKPGWNRIEERIVKETLLLAESQGMPSPVISGIGRFPACTGLAQNDVYKIRMPPEGGLMEPRYHYWVNANPKSLLISEEQWKMIQKSEDVNGTNEYFQILFGKTEDIPSTERLQSMLDNIMNKGGNEA